MTGRTPGSVKTPGSGRKKGSLSVAERKELTAELAKDICDVYRAMGGALFLLEWAKKNPSEFIKNCWARIAPAFPKDDPDIQINQQFNYGQGDLNEDVELARRVAFALAKGASSLQQLQQVNPAYDSAPSPQEVCRATPSFVETPKTPFADSEEKVIQREGPERAEYWRLQGLTPEERLVEETRSGNLYGENCWRGSSPEEQGRAGRPAPAQPRRVSVREKNRRRSELL